MFRYLSLRINLHQHHL